MTTNTPAKRSGKRLRGQRPVVPPHRDLTRVYTYLRHPNVRIRLLAHDTFDAITPRHEREVYIVRNSWYPMDVEYYCRELRSRMEPLRRQIYFLSNTLEIHEARLEAGFNSTYVNFACFIDDNDLSLIHI